MRRLTELQPKAAEPWWLVARAQLQAQDSKAALEALNNSLAVQGDYLPALITRVQVQASNKQFKEALDGARAIQRQFADRAVGYQLEGDVLVAQKQLPAAINAYRTAYDKTPSAALALALAGVQRESGDAPGAVQSLRQWLQANPKDMQVRSQLGVYLELMKRPDEAISEYEQVLAVAPDNVVILNNLAGLYGSRGDTRAIKYAERAVELSQNRPEVVDTLGWVLVQNNQVPRGLTLLKQAAIQAPHIPEIRYHLAMAYHKAGQVAEARKELEGLLKTTKEFEGAKEAQALLDSLKKQP